MKYVFPPDYGVECRLIGIDASFVPIVAGLLIELADAGRWVTDDDYYLAYNAITEMVAGMANDCAKQIVQSTDRLYMLLDGIYNGATYSLVGGEQPVLPLVPSAPVVTAGGLRKQLLDSQGVTPGSWPLGFGARPATMADIVSAMKIGDEDEITRVTDTIDLLDEASDGASIFNAVKSFFVDGAGLSVEGLQLGTMIAATMANAAMMGLQAAQIDQLIANSEALTSQLNSLLLVYVGPGEFVQPVPIVDRQQAWAETQYPAIIDALGLIAGGDSTAALEAINTALGVRADCASGESIIGLLCELNTAIGGAAPEEPPGAACPGYEGGVSDGAFLFANATVDNEPTPSWFCTLTAASPIMPFDHQAEPWSEVAGADLVSFFYLLGPVGAQTSFCFTIEHDGSPNEIQLVRYDAGLGYTVSVATVATGGAVATWKTERTLDAGTLYAFKQVVPNAAMCNSAVWVTVQP